MRLPSLVASLALVAASGLTGAIADDAPKAPKLELAEREYLFEPVLVGEKVFHAFKFKNTGTADLIIRRVDPTCGCTVGKFPHEAIKPGGEGTIELTIDTSEKIGSCFVRATIYSNDTTQVAIGPCTTLVEMKGDVQSCFKLMPLGAYYGPVLRGRQPVARDVRAPGALEAEGGYEITSIEVPVDWIKVEKKALEPAELQAQGAKAGWSLKVLIQPNVPPGDFREWIVVHTNVKKQPTFRFPVVGTASGPVHAHEAILFGQIRRGTESERLVPLERIDNVKGLPILSVDWDKTHFDIKTETIVEDVRTDLRIKVRADAPPGPFMSYVTIRIDLPEQPILRIPIIGDITPRVVADPPILLFGATEKEARFTVRLDKGKKVEARAEGFEVTVEPGSSPVVKLVPKKTLTKGEKLSVELTTDVAGEEKLVVPVEVR